MEKARLVLRDTEEAYRREEWALSILRSTECVEFSLKAAIRLVGGSEEEKDVAAALRVAGDNCPEWFRAKIPQMSLVFRSLAALSYPAKYGGEGFKVAPPSALGRTEAEAYVGLTKQIYFECYKLFYEVKYQAQGRDEGG